ncbi:MAG: SDR family NAD(P)-dependent oxidoreductase [Proteobacteria bacterium]|nr:SDR family NAD(P)-dependent oxidoreductase [Pseudomonadota bacterium]
MAKNTNTGQRGRKHNKVVVVTGGGSGLGRASANRLARDGFTVAVVGRRADRLKPRRGESLHPYPCDVADRGAVAATIKAIRTDLGGIDVLFNCAGVFREVPLAKTTPEQIDYLIGINLFGTINMTVACAPALKKTKGAIINMSSALTARPYGGISLYCAAKGGIEAYTRALAVELAGFGVRANVILPGLVRSEIFVPEGGDAKMLEAELKQWGKTYPLGRAGEPEDIAGLVSYLASNDAAWVTGVSFPVEGGKIVGG